MLWAVLRGGGSHAKAWWRSRLLRSLDTAAFIALVSRLFNIQVLFTDTYVGSMSHGYLSLLLVGRWVSESQSCFTCSPLRWPRRECSCPAWCRCSASLSASATNSRRSPPAWGSAANAPAGRTTRVRTGLNESVTTCPSCVSSVHCVKSASTHVFVLPAQVLTGSGIIIPSLPGPSWAVATGRRAST